MTRHAFLLAITVDVDDAHALAGALLEGQTSLDVDILGMPSADEASSELLFDTIREHAAPALKQHGVHVVGLGVAADGD